MAYKFTNALIHETSPYLLQHAHNPVNWEAWTPDVLKKAKEKNKLIVISIGYSSCHWCHVMEEETFENEEIAELMNEYFICIKVDREERPDIDHIYQSAIQLVRNSGGWPLNIITLPNEKPVYLGTYHTKDQWSQILTQMNNLYRTDLKKMKDYATNLTKGIQDMNLITPPHNLERPAKEDLVKGIKKWKSHWDLTYGGNLGRMKFMLPINLNFILDYTILSGDKPSEAHLKNTLEKMSMGGVYDHIRGGFFRYSTDPQWRVPHFEKMLYDNALLLSLYAKAYTTYKEPVYKEIAQGIIGFLNREMKNPEGGYFSSIDADSEGEEGKFYVWKKEELKSILENDFDIFADYYSIQQKNIWEKENYILRILKDDKAFSKKHKLSLSDLNIMKSRWKKKILKTQEKRIRPHTDDKIITSWNALLITGFLDAYKAFGEKKLLNYAEEIFNFIQQKILQEDQLIHSYKINGRRIPGFLEDYAFLIDASLEMYNVSLEEIYLSLAIKLNQRVEAKFNDISGMYRYNENHNLISKIIKTDDGVYPSPNSVMAHNLFRLGHILYDLELLKKSKNMLSSMRPMISSYTSSYAEWGRLLLYNTYPFFEIVVVGHNAKTIIHELNQKHIPNALITGSLSERNLPLFKNRYSSDKTFIYVCKDNTCKLPVTTVKKAMNQLKEF